MHKLNSYKNFKFIAAVFQRIQHIVYCKYLHAFYILWFICRTTYNTYVMCIYTRISRALIGKP